VMPEGAITRMRKSAEKHRIANPGHVVEEHDAVVRGVTEAWWSCITCKDNASARELATD
jgi:hypothetical protein